MADDRIQSDSEFANQSAMKNSSQHKTYSQQATEQSLEKAQRFAEEAKTAVGGYAISSESDHVAEDTLDHTEGVTEADSLVDSATRAERIRNQTRLRNRRIVSEGEQLNDSQQVPPVEDDGKKAKKSSKQIELEEDEYIARPFIVRFIWWLIRKSLVPIIMVAMLVAGLYIGYSLIGNQPKEEVFEWPTWRHLYDLIFAES